MRQNIRNESETINCSLTSQVIKIQLKSFFRAFVISPSNCGNTVLGRALVGMNAETECANRPQSFIGRPGVAMQDKAVSICDEAVSQPVVSQLCSSWWGNNMKKDL